MASDFADTPVSGLQAVLCGDAHLSNFGLFATPERRQVFDINDFDETYPGPWEWDLKRLAASAVVAGRVNGLSDRKCFALATRASRAYRDAMQRVASISTLDAWYYEVDASSVVKVFKQHAAKDAKQAARTVTKARRQTSGRTLAKLTHMANGSRQIVNAPPLVVRLAELMTEEQKQAAHDQGDVQKAWLGYLASLPEERRVLLSRYRITDAALRVGGVGSVGTRCLITLLEGDRPEDALILQQKEVGPSALERYLEGPTFSSQAERVVVGQHIMQASSDYFLGWSADADGGRFYWRQLKDMKGSFDITALDDKGFATYLSVCGVCLARAHARSGDAVAISGYLGSGTVFDEAIGKFAMAYADQTERDHRALVDAVKNGRIVAETGV